MEKKFASGLRFEKSSVESPGKSATLLAFKKLQEHRKTVPIYAYKDELLQAINDNQVLIIVGETGSGKSTQIPQYLHEAGYTKRGKICCTQPHRVAAITVATRVSQEMGVKLGREVGYSIPFEDRTSKKTILKYMTDRMLLQELIGEPDLASYSVVMLDEAHQRTLSTNMLLTMFKDLVQDRPEPKLLISSATRDPQRFLASCFAPIFEIRGRQYRYEIYHTKAPTDDYLDAAIVAALQIHVMEQPVDGDILIFFPGQEEIETAEEILKHRMKGVQPKPADLMIYPLYDNLPRMLQARIFEPTPEGARKVVLATNIAETSLTIDGIKYVIDSGLYTTKSYNWQTEMESSVVKHISKASANQRAGRSARTGPGKCFRLYTADSYERDLEDNKPFPEIQITNLANVALILKCLGFTLPLFMDPPPPYQAPEEALNLLYALGAVNEDGELMNVGRRMAEFPLDPMLSKMVVASDKYKCSDEIISIVAMLSVGNPIFYRPKAKEFHADSARMKFHIGNVGDHIALLKVYNSWKESGYSTDWCYENYIRVRSMEQAREIRDQLEDLLKRTEIELTSNLKDFDAIKKAITSGFFHHVARLQNNGAYGTVRHGHTVHIHPSSGLAQVLPTWVIYHELVSTSTKVHMRQVIKVKPQWVVEAAPLYYSLKDVADPFSRAKGSGG